MNKRRLLRLAKELDQQPAKHKRGKAPKFHLREWAGDGWQENICGTTACAVGLATTIKAFRQAGLKLVPDAWNVPEPRFRGQSGLDAAASFFEISWEEAEVLFMSGEFPGLPDDASAKDVATLIRRFVKERG